MRTQIQVTENEFLVPEDMVIMSETDLHGTITKVNEAFIYCSGYSQEELIGQPHSILRHPDVPAGVFADMWQTIQKGRGWSQIVKNRRKNGDYYWLRANVGPLTDDNGRISGYISHRMRCDGQEKDIMMELYQDVADGFLTIKEGEIGVPDEFSV